MTVAEGTYDPDARSGKTLVQGALTPCCKDLHDPGARGCVTMVEGT